MKQIGITELNRCPGETIDLVLRNGIVGVTRYGRLAGLLSRDKIETDLEYKVITSEELVKHLSEIFDETWDNKSAYVITRQNREVAWLLPRCIVDPGIVKIYVQISVL